MSIVSYEESFLSIFNRVQDSLSAFKVSIEFIVSADMDSEINTSVHGLRADRRKGHAAPTQLSRGLRS
jgi:hypothetical protein